MKKFFDKDEAWNQEALELDREFYSTLQPIITRWMKRGFNVRHITHIGYHTLFEIECGKVMDMRCGAADEN